MKTVALFSLLGGLFLCLYSSIAWAQSTAQINGTVTDQSGAVRVQRPQVGDNVSCDFHSAVSLTGAAASSAAASFRRARCTRTLTAETDSPSASATAA